MEDFTYIGRKKEINPSNYIVLFLLLILILLISSTFLTQLSLKFNFTNSKIFFQLLPFLVCTILLILAYKQIVNSNVIEIFTSRSKFSFRKFYISFIIWFGILTILFLINYLIKPNHFIFQFDLYPFITLFFIAIFLISIQTLFEELLFRSILIQGFGTIFNSKILIAIFTAALFSFMHLNNPEIKILGKIIIWYYFITGLFLAIITILDHGIELSFGFHAANNLFGTLVLSNNWQVFKTNSIFLDVSDPKISWDFWIILLILYPTLLFIYLKVSKVKLAQLLNKQL